jgi:hypothetical protein
MKKSRKQRSYRRPSKRLSQAKQRCNLQKKKYEPSHSQWLQILPGDIENDRFRSAGRGLIPQSNGGRELREIRLHVAERNLRSGRKFR